jgi:glycosyltransferase involved in cell wall biosynthesis
MKTIKVLHIPSMVGGNPQGLSRALTLNGFSSESWALQQSSFGYSADKVLWVDSDGLISQEMKRMWALSYVCRFDAVCFNFGSGLFPHRQVVTRYKNKPVPQLVQVLFRAYIRSMAWIEVALLRLFRVPIFIFYHGDDARQGDYCRKHFQISFANRVGEEYYTSAKDSATRKSISFYARHATKIYALNPDLLNVLPASAEFMPYSHIDLQEWRPNIQEEEVWAGILRVGHAPSNRAVKGTDLVLAAVDQLKQNGFEIELVLIEGVTNVEARSLYGRVDILVDQLFAGWYGALAVELMALGKPVIAYLRESDLDFIPKEMREAMPVINSEPDQLYSVLERCLQYTRKDLDLLGRRSRAFVENWHDPAKVARRLGSDIYEALKKKDFPDRLLP